VFGLDEETINEGGKVMRRNAVVCAVSLVLVVLLSTVLVGPVAAQNAPPVPIQLPTDRTVLPIPEPQYPHSTVLDARNTTLHPRFEVKAPAGAPNVLIVLIDDFGFGQSSAFGGPSTCRPWTAWLPTGFGTISSIPHRCVHLPAWRC